MLTEEKNEEQNLEIFQKTLNKTPTKTYLCERF